MEESDKLKYARRRLIETEVEYEGAQAGVWAIERHYAWAELRNKYICPYEQSEVMVKFTEGWERCIFEGIKLTPQCHIVLRRFTKKGKPCKKATYHAYDICYSMKRA